MAGFFDFLTTLLKPEEKKDTSVIVKNIISGNNNQNNGNNASTNSKKGPVHPKTPPSSSSKTSAHQLESRHQIELQSIKLYSTGAKGKVYTEKIYKSVNHNFGIEVVIKNNTSQYQTVNLGHCIYDESGTTVIKGNFHPKIAPYTTLTQDIYVKAQAFSKLKNGKYKSQFWLNNKKVQKIFFTISNK